MNSTPFSCTVSTRLRGLRENFALYSGLTSACWMVLTEPNNTAHLPAMLIGVYGGSPRALGTL